jgi:biopolymer transport protein ExbD
MSAPPALPLSALADVVFLLLTFFLFTIRPADVLARADVRRPAFVGDKSLPLLRIDVHREGFRLNGRHTDLPEMDRTLNQIARISRSAEVVVACSPDSAHAGLMSVLDLCSKAGLRNVALASR